MTNQKTKERKVGNLGFTKSEVHTYLKEKHLNYNVWLPRFSKTEKSMSYVTTNRNEKTPSG